jgi:hypothetical protein
MDQFETMAAMSERMVNAVAPGIFAISAPTFPASGIKKERVSSQSRGATTSEQSLGGQRDSLIPGPFWERQIKRMMWSHH